MQSDADARAAGAAIRILFVDTGRKFELEATYGAKLRLLSERFYGDVVTSGKAALVEFGRFAVHSLGKSRFKPMAIERAFTESYEILKGAAAAGAPVQLIVSYDPLTTGLLGLMLSRIFKVPLLVELNGDFTSPANYADVANPLLRALKKKLYVGVERFVLGRCGGIKLLYQRQLEAFAGELPPSVVTRVYPNFLDVSTFSNHGETRRVAIVGFPFHVKGMDIAVAAFKQIAAEFPDWSMEVLGWYAGEEKIALDRCIGEHPQISHHPPVFRQAMAEYIGTCGVVVCASRTEGFPRVIKEAMHAAKPCVVSDVGGLPDAVTHNVNGLVFRSENVDELAQNLRILLSSPQLRQKLGSAARDYAVQEFSNARFLERFSAHVSEILGSRRRGE